MKIVNNTSTQLTVLLNNKAYRFNAGDSMEVTEAEGSWILSIQPLLSKVETVEIHTEPAEMQKKEEPKAKKNVKNKKSRK